MLPNLIQPTQSDRERAAVMDVCLFQYLSTLPSYQHYEEHLHDKRVPSAQQCAAVIPHYDLHVVMSQTSNAHIRSETRLETDFSPYGRIFAVIKQ